MKRLWRRYWVVVSLVAAGLAVAAVHWAVARLTREPPNYSQIEDGLYVGGSVAEPPPGTRAVLNLCERADPYRAEIREWVPIPDAEPAPSLDWLRQRVEFIEAQRAAGRMVFVHCQAGVSRSGMVVVAYEMSHRGWTRDEALAFVRSRRQNIRPNPAFMALLLEWEQAVRKRE
jgi:hypothetical protein